MTQVCASVHRTLSKSATVPRAAGCNDIWVALHTCYSSRDLAWLAVASACHRTLQLQVHIAFSRT